jgi:hypothetical protein
MGPPYDVGLPEAIAVNLITEVFRSRGKEGRISVLSTHGRLIIPRFRLVGSCEGWNRGLCCDR